MNKMKWSCFPVIFLFLLISVSVVHAEESTDYDHWEKYSVSLGGFLSAVDTKVRLGSSSLGVDLDLEEVAGLDSTDSTFRMNALGRFGASKKHMVDVSYFYYDRGSSRTLLFNQNLGSAGDTVRSTFNIQLYKADYNYSLLMDDRINFSAGIGVYVMPIEVSLANDNDATKLEVTDITALLPALNLRLEFALTPKIYLRQSLELFYLEYGGFTGSLVDINICVDYRISKHFGLGLGLDTFSLNLKANGKDYPGINFNGEILFRYSGLMLYGKYYF